MRQTNQSTSQPNPILSQLHAKPLHQQIAEAVQNRATPISQLLRLMSALDAEPGANENLRLQLRTRIGAPLTA
ncbi:hypothetical protein [Methylobacterium sp. A54F]|jgi:hypothetical protein